MHFLMHITIYWKVYGEPTMCQAVSQTQHSPGEAHLMRKIALPYGKDCWKGVQSKYFGITQGNGRRWPLSWVLEDEWAFTRQREEHLRLRGAMKRGRVIEAGNRTWKGGFDQLVMSLACQAKECGPHISGHEESTEVSLHWRLSRAVWTGKDVLQQPEDRFD